MEYTKCCLCGSEDNSKIWSHNSDRFLRRLGIDERVVYCVCRVCGLAYANPRLSDDEIERLYTDSYRQEKVSKEHVEYKACQSRQRIEYLKNACPGLSGDVLEIGSSE